MSRLIDVYFSLLFTNTQRPELRYSSCHSCLKCAKNEGDLPCLFYNAGSAHRHSFKQASKVRQTSEVPDAETFSS